MWGEGRVGQDTCGQGEGEGRREGGGVGGREVGGEGGREFVRDRWKMLHNNHLALRECIQ